MYLVVITVIVRELQTASRALPQWTLLTTVKLSYSADGFEHPLNYLQYWCLEGFQEGNSQIENLQVK